MTRRQTPAMVAAGRRADAALACLEPEERRIMVASFGQCGTEAELEAFAAGFGLTVDELAVVLNRAGEKLDAHYAAFDAAEARRAGRLQ